jgi:hypothetical protein
MAPTVALRIVTSYDDATLRAAYDALVGALGKDADRVVIYLSGRTAAGDSVGPADVGLPDRPTGRDLARMSTP